jgi:hypothetical protein
VKGLFRSMDYGRDTGLGLKGHLDVVVLLDRGYHVSSVIRFLLKMGCRLLGTHSEKAGTWPFCTGKFPKAGQISVTVDGVRTALFSSRTINNVTCWAVCYRNGTKGAVMLHTTLPFAGTWDDYYVYRLDCFRPWHTYKRLPKTPSSAEVITQEDEGDGTTLALL